MTFAIDRIPSLADAMPYASYVILYGDESDGVPAALDGYDTSPRLPRQPPRASTPLAELDETQRIRKARP